METSSAGSGKRSNPMHFTRRLNQPTTHNHKTNKIISRLTYNPVKHKQQEN